MGSSYHDYGWVSRQVPLIDREKEKAEDREKIVLTKDENPSFRSS